MLNHNRREAYSEDRLEVHLNQLNQEVACLAKHLLKLNSLVPVYSEEEIKIQLEAVGYSVKHSLNRFQLDPYLEQIRLLLCP